MNDSDESMKYFATMQMLASDLAKKHIAIYQHRFDMLTFGNFFVVVGTRHKRWRFIWDGKEGVMTVSVAAIADSREVPEWRISVSEYPSGSPYDYINDYGYETT